MSDDIKLDQDDSKKPLEDKSLESRRKFTKAGIGGGAVLMSLLSRPATAGFNNDPRCTGSILASIDAGTSLHDFNPDECRFGCTPGFWSLKVNNKGTYSPPPTWRAWEYLGMADAILHPTTQFIDLFTCGPGPGFNQGTTLFDIVGIPNENSSFLKQAARHSIAAYLNAKILGAGHFGLYPADVISGYCMAYKDWVDSGETDGSSLSTWHGQMASLNERNCPLDNNPSNPFYNEAGIH
jgi:hypothetical protein